MKHKMVEFLTQYQQREGVYQISEMDSSFEEVYLETRRKESRIHADNTVAKLPQIDRNHVHYMEWTRRSKSMQRIVRYFEYQKRSLRILDVGCGNGWFSNHLARIRNSEVLGIDINMTELKQATRLFTRSNLFFAYADFLRNDLPEGFFDVIVLNSVIQYFPDLSDALKRLLRTLAKDGEVHILDSPVYRKKDLDSAKERTDHYYESLGCERGQTYYYHHCWEDFEPLVLHLLYDSRSIWNKVRNRIFTSDSPFPWFKIIKNTNR